MVIGDGRRLRLTVLWAPVAVALMPWSCTRGSSDEAARRSDGGDTDAPGTLDSSSDVGRRRDARGVADAGRPTEPPDASTHARRDASMDASGDASPCTTTVSYGQAWIHGANHPAAYDVAPGEVTWDGSCTTDGENSYATLSNGWKPYFTGQDGCILGLDYAASCGEITACSTRVTYGAAWIQPAGHSNPYDDVAGRVFSDGQCTGAGSDSYATLSNGWQPHFSGDGACGLSFRYVDCGGLYANPVILPTWSTGPRSGTSSPRVTGRPGPLRTSGRPRSTSSVPRTSPTSPHATPTACSAWEPRRRARLRARSPTSASRWCTMHRWARSTRPRSP